MSLLTKSSRMGFAKSVARIINRRSIHVPPILPNQSKWSSEGIEGLYSREGFQVAWTDYQKFLTMNLSAKTAGTENENKHPFHIVLNTAKKSYLSQQFHYASQAHNNHFFFEQLIEPKSNKSSPSALLKRKINQSFGDLESFKEEFLYTADTMIGQGWVFLTEDIDKSLKILPCLNDGTPYFYGRNQSLDLNGPIDEHKFDYMKLLKKQLENGEKDWTLPLLAVNCWDYAYIQDYGVSGRAAFLTNFWDAINWDVVNQRVYQS